MSTIELIILGFLSTTPMSAYELVQLVEKNPIDKFLKISTPAVYKSCIQLQKSGFLDYTVAKARDHPTKKIYQINAQGRARFGELMEHFSSTFNPFFLDCNAFLWNIEKMEKTRGLELLENLHQTIIHLQGWIMEHERESQNLPFASRAIIRQYRMMIATLKDWCHETITEYATQS